MTNAAQALPARVSASALFCDVYDRLKVMAVRQRARAGQPASMSATEVVHELYLRMCGDRELAFGHELEFFAYAARAMRHVLVDLARRRMSLKEGGDLVRVDLGDSVTCSASSEPALALELHSALEDLQRDAPRAAEVVELHYFAGLSLQAVAGLFGLSLRTVDRDWRYARAFLAARMAS